MEDISLFRFNNTPTKAFITEGKIISTPKSPTAFRTQIEASQPKHAVELLKNHPLGNHHLILPGSYCKILEMVYRLVR